MNKGKKKKVRQAPSRVWIFTAILGAVVIFAVVAGMLTSSRTASAQQANIELQSASGTTDDDNDTTIQYANQKITIDAQTGKLRKPTAEEARALVENLTQMTNRSTKGLQVEKTHNGRSKVDLQGRFQTVVLAKPNPDGTNEVRCVSSMEEAAQFLGLDPAKLPAKNQ